MDFTLCVHTRVCMCACARERVCVSVYMCACVCKPEPESPHSATPDPQPRMQPGEPHTQKPLTVHIQHLGSSGEVTAEAHGASSFPVPKEPSGLPEIWGARPVWDGESHEDSGSWEDTVQVQAGGRGC